MNTKRYVVRTANLNDINSLVGFNQAMALETEGKKLSNSKLSAGVRHLIEQPQYGFYLIAQNETNAIVGGLMVTYEWSDWRDGLFWWIQSVYVLPSERRKGVYGLLHDQVVERARQAKNVCGLRLYVEKDNQTAQQTYQAKSMKQSHYRMFETIW